jgi:hypothetical protein
MISVRDAHEISKLLHGIMNANSWQEAKKQCRSLPEMKTCFRWKNNQAVLELLREATHPVEITSKSDIWNRLYTVTMTSGEKSVTYSY